jgi:hypothetical protein
VLQRLFGLSNDPRLRQAVEHAVGSAEAVASTGSRLLSGNSRDWEELESDFSEFAGTEATLYFTSGYAANVGLLSSHGPTSANSEEQRNEETPLLAKEARNGAQIKWTGNRSSRSVTSTVRKLPFPPGQHLRTAHLHRPGW